MNSIRRKSRILPSNCETEGLFRSHDVIFILLGKWDQEMAGGLGREKKEQREARVGGYFTAASNETNKEESVSPALLNSVGPRGEDNKR